MFIKKIEVNSDNLMEVIRDTSVYVIKKDYFKDGYRMARIGDADVKDILSDNVLIIKIME